MNREEINNIDSKEKFIEFLNSLVIDFKNNSSEWENKTVDSYLEAIQSWVEDMDGYYKNMGDDLVNNVDWQVIATILSAGKIYE